MSEARIATEEDVAALFRFLNEVAIISQLSGAAFEKVMPGKMTLPQFAVLNHLSRLGGNRTPLRIATALQVSKAAMTNTLGHLDRSGWISIRPDDSDGRSKRVDVTDAGRAAHAAALAALVPELAWLSDAIGAERVRAATPLLEEMRRALDERRG
jgi:DNA-binding MarR family transcriptional regulator